MGHASAEFALVLSTDEDEIGTLREALRSV